MEIRSSILSIINGANTPNEVYVSSDIVFTLNDPNQQLIVYGYGTLNATPQINLNLLRQQSVSLE